MRYATVQDMLDRFAEAELAALTDPESGAVNHARIETKLDDAQAVIDGRVGKVYRLPLQGCVNPAGERVMPPQLVRIACDLARFWLRDSVQEDSDVYRRYKAAMSELDDIARGTAQLACPWGGLAGEPLTLDSQQGAEVYFSFASRAITDDSLRGF